MPATLSHEVAQWGVFIAWSISGALLATIVWMLKELIAIGKAFIIELRSEVRGLAERQERADRERTELKERIESARRLELEQLRTVDAKIDGLSNEIQGVVRLIETRLKP